MTTEQQTAVTQADRDLFKILAGKFGPYAEETDAGRWDKDWRMQAIADRRLASQADQGEDMRKALEPFAEYADPRGIFPSEMLITPGSNFARRQLTMGDCYAAKAALATHPQPSQKGEGDE